MAVSDSLAMYGQSQVPSPGIRVEDHATLVKRIAHHMMVRMPASVQVEDLIQAGMIGLLEGRTKIRCISWRRALRRTQEFVFVVQLWMKCVKVIGCRVRYTVITDAYPKLLLWLRPERGVMLPIRRFAVALEMTLDEYYHILKDNSSSRLFSYEETFTGEDSGVSLHQTSMAFITPHDNMQREGLKASLAAAIADLPERERMILALYYDEELNLKEIGQIIGVSESRVSQIHSQATARLRSRLSDWRKSDMDRT